MKARAIEQYIEAYENNDLSKCTANLFFLLLSYNADIGDGKSYDHNLKHILFKRNCIRNPIGMKYTSKDYEKISEILSCVLRMALAINNPEIDTQDICQEGLSIDDRIIKDILDMAIYTDCFYNMNIVNSKRIDECEISKIPFVEQLITILLFHQDQLRLVRQNYTDFLNKDYITGMELSVANRAVEYYENLNCSVTDSFESLLESMNEIAHYLYYQFGKNLETEIKATDIKFELIRPYKNAEFERYLYIALQRYLLCRLEEGIRYGYYEVGSYDKTKENIRTFLFSLENDEKYKARSIGLLRREYQLRNHAITDFKSQSDISLANEKLPILANELINVQCENYALLDFTNFHPDKNLFLEAESVSKVKEHVVELLTKDYYFDCHVKGIKIRDLLCAYGYLYTLSEILYIASMSLIDTQNPHTYVKEICLVDISYLSMELARIHGFEINYAENLVDRFIFHEKQNRGDDIFAQPLLKVSKTQIVLSQALLEQVNLDRFIERQFIRYEKNVSEVGHAFEREFVDTLKRGYLNGLLDLEYKEIPNFAVNTNEVKYGAFDGKEIEFDVIAVLGDYLILTELKAVMTSYDLNDLENRKRNIKEAINQLQRRAESVIYDWAKIKELVSIELPDQPFDQDHIILVVCTDTYDYTPLKHENIFITDDSSYLKYFTNPYIDAVEAKSGNVTIRNLKRLWKNGYPDAKEFMEYLTNPVTIHPFSKSMKKQTIPLPAMDENDYAIFYEDYKLTEDPIITSTMQKEV